MKRPQEIAKDAATMSTMVKLTSVFESIASMRIGQIKNQVLQSQEFFSELWNMYSQLRVDSFFRYGRNSSEGAMIDKELVIVITAEGGFSGDIDQKLINLMLSQYDQTKQDIIVIGHHGAIQLAQQGIGFKRYFKLPEKDQNINVMPIVKEIQQYRNTTVYYQTYVSLMVQDVKRIALSAVVQEQGKSVEASEEVISEATYIFEPSTFAVVNHLERSMLTIALSQLILDSKLAQFASRFRAMSMAHDKADETFADLHVLYNRARRSTNDERLKEIVNGLRQTGVVV